MHARQIRARAGIIYKELIRNAETLYSSEYSNIIIIANAHETVNMHAVYYDIYNMHSHI